MTNNISPLIAASRRLGISNVQNVCSRETESLNNRASDIRGRDDGLSDGRKRVSIFVRPSLFPPLAGINPRPSSCELAETNA